MNTRHSIPFGGGVLSMVLLSAGAWGSSFALLEQSGSGLGRAFAGSAAIGDDASTVFYNPAALMRLDTREALVSVSGIDISSHFHDGASAAALGQPLGSDGGNAGSFTVLPSFYLSWPLTPSLAAGLGINAPFGLKTEYDGNWIGRFQAIRSDVRTLNVNPSLAWRINRHVSLGVGLDYQRINATLSSAVNYTAVLGQVNPALVPDNLGLQGATNVKGDDSGWGFNLGALFELDDATRVGLAYRSAIRYSIEGNASFTAPTASNPVAAGVIAAASAPGGPLANGSIGLDLKVPDSATLSLVRKLNEHVSLMADVAWTGWSSVQELRVVRTGASPLSITPERWKDTWRFSAGGEYEVNPRFTLRAGVAVDQAPVPDTTRTPRLPDDDRTWLAVGASWAPSSALKIDAGYAHLLVKDASLNDDGGNAPAYGVIDGTQKSNINIVAVQAALKF